MPSIAQAEPFFHHVRATAAIVRKTRRLMIGGALRPQKKRKKSQRRARATSIQRCRTRKAELATRQEKQNTGTETSHSIRYEKKVLKTAMSRYHENRTQGEAKKQYHISISRVGERVA